MEYELQEPSCGICSFLDPDWWYQELSITSFRNSSEQGCQRCKVLTKVLESSTSEAYEKYDFLVVPCTTTDRFSMDRKIILQVQPDKRGESSWAFEEATESILELEISKLPAIPCSWSNISEASAISGDTGSDVAVDRVRAWIDQCMSQHDSCNRAVQDILPTRLLQIKGPKEVRLHCTRNETDPYACLSYCWGTNPFIRTTSSTLHQYQSNIQWTELPKTFQDAISFTHRLGIRYLWIDSLCIIQDSVEDWRYESGQMANTYKNARLTIAATHSIDASGGCFSTAHPKHYFRHWTFTDSDLRTSEFHTRIPLAHSDFVSGKLPLSRRGWAFQERMLSPRVIHFTEQELIWECLENTTCECSQVVFDIGTPDKKVCFALSLQEADRQWRKLVLWYTHARLTFTKDIFPALQGLAKDVHPALGSYLAGLWSNTLIPNLAWVSGPESSFVQFNRPKEWRAPTWSWASTTGTIVWIDPKRKTFYLDIKTSTFIEVVNCIIVAKGEDNTGELVSGELKIRGHCVGGTISYTADHVFPYGHPGLVLRLDEAGTDGEGQMIFSSTYISWDYSIKTPGLYHVADGSDVVVVKIDEVIDRYKAISRWLILRPVQGYSNTFERIGLLTIEVSHPPSEQPIDMARGLGVDYGKQNLIEAEIQSQLAWEKEEDMKRQLNMAHKTAPEMEFTIV